MMPLNHHVPAFRACTGHVPARVPRKRDLLPEVCTTGTGKYLMCNFLIRSVSNIGTCSVCKCSKNIYIGKCRSRGTSRYQLERNRVFSQYQYPVPANLTAKYTNRPSMRWPDRVAA